jgi:phosphoribosylformylglycinamidine (FGAM) synthase PurS component
VDVEPGVVGDEESGVPEAIRVPELQQQVFSVVAGPDDESESVVSVLQKLREEYGIDPEAEEVRSALQALRRKGVVEVVYRTVPTFKLTVERDSVEVSVSD